MINHLFRSLVVAAASAVLISDLAAQHAGTSGSSPRIIVEPDFIASRDGNAPHVEVHVAANPRRPRNLIVGAITHTRADATTATKVYTTFDGGRVWTDTVFPEQVERGGGDPQVAFTPVGTAIFATLNRGVDDSGRTRAFLHVYRSEDGGRTWSKPADLGASYDHEMITVDQSSGRFAGRIYLSALYGREYQLGVFRSEDDGRSFIGPVEIYRAGGKTLGANVLQMGVFSDGAVLATYHDFPLGPGREKSGPLRSGFFTVISEDGGVTFSKPRPAPDEVFPAYNSAQVRMAGDAGIAIDTGSAHRDRVYRVWNDARAMFESNSTKGWRIYISTSDDRGNTWTDPRIIDAAAPEKSHQFLPAIAVNRDGIVGVSWQDTRDAPDAEFGYRVYFTASVDGGKTFLPPVPVSTEWSRPHAAGNLMYTPSTFTTPTDGGSVRMTFLSAAGRWGNGGDYTGMAADADGVFHPTWADSRTGTFQVMTARVRVERQAPVQTSTKPDGPATAQAPPRERSDVTSRIEFVSDPSRYDRASKELELRIRLKNTSDRPLHGPLTLTIKKFGSGMGEDGRDRMPTVLNASNSKPNDGATFVYDAALGTEGVLPPGGVSGPVLLRFRVVDPLRIPDMHLLVEGFVRP
jgi:hypothetical protein